MTEPLPLQYDAGALRPDPGGLNSPARLTIVLAVAMLAGMLLSSRLWVSDRAFPLSPVTDLLPTVSPPWDALWFTTLILLLLAIILLPEPRRLIQAFVVLAALLALFDQTRWQPWFYQYLFMLGALAVFRWDRDGSGARALVGAGERELCLNACRLIVAFTYLYSGLQKFNHSFVNKMAPYLLQPIADALPDAAARRFTSQPIMMAIVETAIGVCLLVARTRPFAVVGAVMMHLMIMWSLGPFGLNWNTVVWPWNLAMVALVLILFTRTGPLPPRAWLPAFSADARWRVAYYWLVVLLFAVMPAFNFFHRWDSYLSAALYSANTFEATVDFGPATYRQLPEAVKQSCYDLGRGRRRVNVLMWAIGELNTPGYPARRVYLNIGKTLQRRAAAAPRETHPVTGKPVETDETIVVRVYERPEVTTGKREETVYEFPEPAAEGP